MGYNLNSMDKATLVEVVNNMYKKLKEKSKYKF